MHGASTGSVTQSATMKDLVKPETVSPYRAKVSTEGRAVAAASITSPMTVDGDDGGDDDQEVPMEVDDDDDDTWLRRRLMPAVGRGQSRWLIPSIISRMCCLTIMAGHPERSKVEGPNFPLLNRGRPWMRSKCASISRSTLSYLRMPAIMPQLQRPLPLPSATRGAIWR